MGNKQRMGEVLVELGLIDEHRLKHALQVSRKDNLKLGETIIRLGYLSEEQVLEMLKNLTGVEILSMKDGVVKKNAQTMLSPERMKEMKVIPLYVNGRKAVVAFADPLNYLVVENIKFLINKDVTPVLASLAQVEDILTHLDREGYGVKNLDLSMVRRSAMNMTIQEIGSATVLKLLDEPGCTGLHLSIGSSPAVKTGGVFKRCNLPIITSAIMKKIIREVVSDHEIKQLIEKKEIEYTCVIPGQGRYRMNIYYQKGGGITIAAKKLVEDIPTAVTLGLPEMLISLTNKRGLLLISSTRGEGKDTTIAALVDHINSTRSCNIITFEDPIEYIHQHKLSNVNQRELGRDTNKNLPEVFDRVVKLDPDVLVISNLKDMFMMDTAVLAAHKGILVIAGINAIDVFNAVEQFMSSLSDEYMKALFSRSILAVFAQRLMWSKSAKGRILAWEGLLASPRIQKYMRDDKIYYVKGQAPSLRGEYFPIEESVAQAIKEARLDYESVKSEPWINHDALKALLER
jgi:twitching motility protein PilT